MITFISYPKKKTALHELYYITEKEGIMKKILVFALAVSVVLTAGTVIAAAESTPADTTTSATVSTPAPVKQPVEAADGTTTASVTATDPGSNVVIAPDSLLYPIKKMIESVQVALTFTAEGKAELLVSFANERLAEANLMTERNRQELVQKVMEAYIKTMNEAAEKAAEAAQDQTDVKPLLESIQITEQTADNIVIKATGIVPADVAGQLKTAVAVQVKKTIAVQAAAEAKDQFNAANDSVKQARETLKLAEKGGDEALIKAANDELLKAQDVRKMAQQLKKEAEAYKGQINESLKHDDEDDDQFDEQDEDKDDGDQLDEQLDEQDNEKDDGDHEHQKIKEHGDRNKDSKGNKDDSDEND